MGTYGKEFSKKTNHLNDNDSHYNIGLLLNIDWFKPFDHTEYKVSTLMMSPAKK